jgi:tRNA pseudouridine13 synthase
MKSFPFEQYIGINNFLTNQQGIGGVLRHTADDFVVDENFLYPKNDSGGCFVIAEISAKNWETHRLVKTLAKQLHISQKRISFAGTKDKRACSTQLMSFENVSEEDIKKINLKDVSIAKIYRSQKSVHLGDLIGNHFRIIIRNLCSDVKPSHIDSVKKSLDENNGFPNFFGIQRFGVIRPITHIVGKHIVLGDFKSAVLTYIANPIKGEDEHIYKLRKSLHETHDYAQALKQYPDVLNFEKAMLNHLIGHNDDFVGALQKLPKNLLLMFINAYQSYLFNKMVSQRIEKQIPLHQAVIGDSIIPLRLKSSGNQYINVTTLNIEKVNKQLKKNKAVVSTLLFGSESLFSKGVMGEIEQDIVDKEDVKFQDFIIPKIPFLSSRGTRRAVLGCINDMNWCLQKDDRNTDKKMVVFSFDLLKGCYATSLLREFMKSNNPKDY